MTILIPLLVALAGLVLYALSTTAKPAEVGRICFFVGLLVALFDFAHSTLSFGR